MRGGNWIGAILLTTITALSCRGSSGDTEVERPSENATSESTSPPAVAVEEPPPPLPQPRRVEPPNTPAEPSVPEVEADQAEQPAPAPVTSDASPRQPEAGRSEEQVGESAAQEDEARGASLEPELLETEGLRVVRIALARGVEEREPVGAGRSFSASEDERIYAYLELANPERVECEISVAWAPVTTPDDETGRVEVRVGPQPRWRTWSYTSRLDRPGRYMAIVRDADGRVIARAPFELTP